MEVNFDGIVGPTHNYSGLSYGNVASKNNQNRLSNPREAALQGLKKMRFLMDLGVRQAILLPHERPHLPTLRALGYRGKDAEIIAKASRENPELFQACTSAAAMWTANAATVTPSSDSADRKVHITPANLLSKLHRSIEAPTTYAMLKAIFRNQHYFTVHPPVPYLPDEGAANHTRFDHGVHLFVYGKELDKNPGTAKFPPRQSLEAFKAISKNHLLHTKKVIFAQQNPAAIDAGVFHNDVISTGYKNLFLYHPQAFVDTENVINQLRDISPGIQFIEAKIPLEDAVNSYLFNSQIVTTKEGKTVLIAPEECKEIASVCHFIQTIPKEHIQDVHYLNLKESMLNGGGPACLRLRIELTEEELKAVKQEFLLTPLLALKLEEWIKKNYRDRLNPRDLGDPHLCIEVHQALDELTQIINLNSFYNFQI